MVEGLVGGFGWVGRGEVSVNNLKRCVAYSMVRTSGLEEGSLSDSQCCMWLSGLEIRGMMP